MAEGLSTKYLVVHGDGEPLSPSRVKGYPECFVLRPDRDRAARMALHTYACATPNRVLAADLLEWLNALRAAKQDEENSNG